jgi:hypothetical protein
MAISTLKRFGTRAADGSLYVITLIFNDVLVETLLNIFKMPYLKWACGKLPHGGFASGNRAPFVLTSSGPFRVMCFIYKYEVQV